MVYSPTSQSNSSIMDSLPTTGILDDVPPTYEEAASSASATGEPSGSGSGGEPSTARWPASMDVLFSGPPNAEPLITRERAAEISNITVDTESSARVELCDNRFNNPDTLYDFIRAQALQAPTVQIRAYATHKETAQRQQHIMQTNGVTTQVAAGQKYDVIDFDFTIDLTPVFAHANNMANVSLFTYGTQTPVRRGTLSRMFGSSLAPNYPGARVVGRRPNWTERRRWDDWALFRKERGRPAWADMSSDDEFWAQHQRNPGPNVTLGDGAEDEEALLPTQPGEHDTALRAWCEAYAADPGLLKSFTLTKDVWGWDLANLRHAIERVILSTGYQPSDNGIKVDLKYGKDSTVTVHSDNILARVFFLLKPWYMIMLFFWMFPLVWIWQRLDRRRAGGPYEVAVASYGMKTYPPLPNTFPNESVEDARHRLPALYKLHPEIPKNPFLHKGPKGVHYLLGRREGEWFREWEERMRMAVRMRYTGELTNPRVFEDEEGPELDGYNAEQH